MNLKDTLATYLAKSLKNNYANNWDYHRFGAEPIPEKWTHNLKQVVKDILMRSSLFNGLFVKRYLEAYGKTIDQFSFLYEQLEDAVSRQILINVIAYRLLGHRKVKIYLGELDYFSEMEKIQKAFDKSDFIIPEKFQVKQSRINLTTYGFPISMYLSNLGIFYDFVYKQYELKREGLTIKVEEGETVIDGGGCFGDTALYFSFLAGQNGNVISFEFIPGNIDLFKKNISLNPNISKNITLEAHPLWDESDINVFFTDMGPGSVVDFKSDFNYDGIVKTISIDDYVERNKIQKIGFIKLDIEGAEFKVLQGARKTIIKDKPKLAIALYHSLEDFDRIPRLIKSFNPEYKFYFQHATINREESVLFAI